MNVLTYRSPLLLVAACAVGCAPVDVPPPGTPALHFFVNARPQDPASAPAEATEARYGDPFYVVVDGVDPGVRVTIQGQLELMTTAATFVADADGVVDLSRDAPVEGAWEGVDPEALIWSLAGDPTPSSPPNLAVTVTAVVDDAEVASGVLARRYINDGIVVEDVADGTTVGALAIPAGDGPFPAVLVFGGSEGGTGGGIFQAQYLASLGYAALGVGYFGAPGLPQTLSDVPLEILEGDLAFLTADPRIDPDRIAVMGSSRGGELALLLGAHFPVVKAVVANVPSGVVWGGNAGVIAAAWTLAGVDVPYVGDHGGNAGIHTTLDSDALRHVDGADAFDIDIANAPPDELAAATTHVEDTGGPILLLGAGADRVWPSCTLADIAWQRLQASHVQSFHDQNLCFADAGHLIGTPGWSTADASEVFVPTFGVYLVAGGTPAGQGHADRDADTAIRGFLDENL